MNIKSTSILIFLGISNICKHRERIKLVAYNCFSMNFEIAVCNINYDNRVGLGL